MRRKQQELQFETGSDRVFGRNAILELLKTEQTVEKLFVKRGEKEGSLRKILSQAYAKGIVVVEVSKEKLDEMCPSGAAHQGVVATVAQKEYVTVEDLLQIAAERGEDPFLVLLDGVNDPHNLGALIRVAEGAGCHGMIIPKRRSATITAVAAKASAGAVAHLPIAKVSNISNAIDELKKAGVWIYAAEAGGTEYDETEIITPAAFILGSEGDGVSRLAKENSDFILSIPMKGKVNSLNVSSAGAVILFHARRFFK